MSLAVDRQLELLEDARQVARERVLVEAEAGVSRAALVLLGLGGLMAWHVPIGPPALVCLSAAAYLIERRRESLPARDVRPVVAS